MTSASMTFGRPARSAVPRFGQFVTHFFGSVAAAMIHGLRRTDQWQLSLKRPQPQTAEEVLDWANAIETTEPGFAADLRAAALRAMDKPGR